MEIVPFSLDTLLIPSITRTSTTFHNHELVVLIKLTLTINPELATTMELLQKPEEASRKNGVGFAVTSLELISPNGEIWRNSRKPACDYQGIAWRDKPGKLALRFTSNNFTQLVEGSQLRFTIDVHDRQSLAIHGVLNYDKTGWH